MVRPALTLGSFGLYIPCARRQIPTPPAGNRRHDIGLRALVAERAAPIWTFDLRTLLLSSAPTRWQTTRLICADRAGLKHRYPLRAIGMLRKLWPSLTVVRECAATRSVQR